MLLEADLTVSLEVAVMECPFHAGNEAITTCVQCETPICTLCAEETNQIHLCLNCYRARIEEYSSSLSSASARLAAERQKVEAKSLMSRKKKKAAAAAGAAATAAIAAGAAESLREREDVAPVAPGEMAPPPGMPSHVPGAMPGVIPAAAAAEAPSKKELARMQKEEAKRLKEEKKAEKKVRKAEPEVTEAPAAVPEPAPFFEPTPEPPDYTPPPDVTAVPEDIPQTEAAPTPAAPTPFGEMPPPGYPTEPPSGGVRLPRLDERLEPLPPRRDEDSGTPSGTEPPEGFFD